ncbi:uncharacterized protein PHALS_13695 [Plasmopara halstedii]|uniref:Uncharacterized protein n=1 Tax=Plasmopara halstedii TaxID=4781 RepID=A0A0P1AQ98_PLAHL|nr:uncharacterized protein PHALS_13695 [Plasmopara halstedii]CEG43502.1 hypothetical protein PHALS_13695 [Plasmopara halstedii]|eukprot:XP_024579871.1 hypothetical protein PHALS_13695 [Plasmopara halstedii]
MMWFDLSNESWCHLKRRKSTKSVVPLLVTTGIIDDTPRYRVLKNTAGAVANRSMMNSLALEIMSVLIRRLLRECELLTDIRTRSTKRRLGARITNFNVITAGLSWSNSDTLTNEPPVPGFDYVRHRLVVETKRNDVKMKISKYDMGFNHSSLRMAIREQLDETRSNFD